MDSSGSEDEQAVQEELWRHLSACLDKQIGDDKRKRKADSERFAKQRHVESTDASVSNQKRGQRVDRSDSLSRVKELTRALKKQGQLNRESSRQQQDIQNKMRELLSKPFLNSESKFTSQEDDKGLSEDDNSYELDEDSDWNSSGSVDNDDDDDDECEMDNVQLSSVAHKDVQLEKFKQALGITEADFVQTPEQHDKAFDTVCEERVKTIALCKNNKPRQPPTIVVFENGQSKARRGKSVPSESGDVPNFNSPTFDMKQARFEVKKFGIRGLQGSEKEAGMIDVLVELGAKPPKRKYVNYKDLQQQRKEELEKAAAKRELDRTVGFKIVKTDNKKRQRKDRNDVGAVDGQVGSYRQGVQVISKKHLKQLKKSKTRR